MGLDVECRVVLSRTARKMRIKVEPDLVRVICPDGREAEEAVGFLRENREWIVEQLVRVRRLRVARRPARSIPGKVVFRGERVRLQVVHDRQRNGPNRVTFGSDGLLVTCAPNPRTAPSVSLENWFRKEARRLIEAHLARVTKRLKRVPNRVYVMSQKTKWGNCSALGNLSFNWRLILAPDFVLRYIVTHEAVHLAIPDHSARFWLTVQSLCPETERARQWLVSNGGWLKSEMRPGAGGARKEIPA